MRSGASSLPGRLTARSLVLAERPFGVVFDGDDTLWSTEQLYDDARTAAGAVVAAAGFSAGAWEHLERRIDVENVVTMGHSAERFPTSCVQAYGELCHREGARPDPEVAEGVRTAARSVFERVAPVVPGARETIGRLRANGARLALMTKGDAAVQARRVASSGLGEMFDVVEIVREKSPEAIGAVVAALGVEVEDAWMVGNSLRSDVLPALEAGLHAVWVDAHVWEYERADDHLVSEQVITARCLAEIPDLIARHD